jgi:hypothetical protein
LLISSGAVGQVDAVEGVVASAVGVLGQRGGDVEQEATQASGVFAEYAKNLLLGDTVVSIYAGVEVRDERESRVTQSQFPG